MYIADSISSVNYTYYEEDKESKVFTSSFINEILIPKNTYLFTDNIVYIIVTKRNDNEIGKYYISATHDYQPIILTQGIPHTVTLYSYSKENQSKQSYIFSFDDIELSFLVSVVSSFSSEYFNIYTEILEGDTAVIIDSLTYKKTSSQVLTIDKTIFNKLCKIKITIEPVSTRVKYNIVARTKESPEQLQPNSLRKDSLFPGNYKLYTVDIGYSNRVTGIINISPPSSQLIVNYKVVSTMNTKKEITEWLNSHIYSNNTSSLPPTSMVVQQPIENHFSFYSGVYQVGKELYIHVMKCVYYLS